MSLGLPPQLILLATVHGGLMVESGQMKTFTVPEGIKVTRIMATRPGICNVTTEEQIIHVSTGMKTIGLTPEDVETTVHYIQPTQDEVVKSVMGQLKSDTANNGLFVQFLRSRISKPTVKEFNPGDTMLDKYFARDSTEGSDSEFDYKLNALNVVGNPDIFDVVTFKTTGPAVRTRSKQGEDRQMYMSELLETLKGKGVKHLVFYDFTCSSFMSDRRMTERDERQFRRNILQQGWGKKRKTRRQKNKTKTRRGKKRTVVKWSY